jgi:hypothetical protein
MGSVFCVALCFVVSVSGVRTLGSAARVRQLSAILCEGVRWMKLALDHAQWLDLVCGVMNIHFCWQRIS